MPSIAANGIEIEYESVGDLVDPPLLLIMGLGAQMTAWDDEFVAELVSRRFRVVRFDNRDIGKSTWLDSAGGPDVAGAIAQGTLPAPAYLLTDMADDAAGLLDGLGIASAHIVGASMGGMIAQSLAIRHPQRVLSLVSIMSTTGNPLVGMPHPEVLQGVVLASPPTTRDEAVEAGVASWKLIGSPGYPVDEGRIRARVGAAYDRAFHPEGVARQLVAIVSSPDRTGDLGQVTCPTLVIHGEEDRLIDPSGGRATADAVPGSQLCMIPGMGHDLPSLLFGEVATRIDALCRSV